MLNRDGLFARRDLKTEDTPRKENSTAPIAQNAVVAQHLNSVNNVRPSPSGDSVKVHATAPSIETRAPAATEGSKLIVGPNIKLKGVEISDCDVLIVEGHVEATVISRALHIAPTGTFNGQATIDEAEINGDFVGELTARKRLVIKATGKISGKIRYGKLVVEEGGELSGDVKTANGANNESESPSITLASSKPQGLPARH